MKVTNMNDLMMQLVAEFPELLTGSHVRSEEIGDFIWDKFALSEVLYTSTTHDAKPTGIHLIPRGTEVKLSHQASLDDTCEG
jgi:hypothetical protein